MLIYFFDFLTTFLWIHKETQQLFLFQNTFRVLENLSTLIFRLHELIWTKIEKWGTKNSIVRKGVQGLARLDPYFWNEKIKVYNAKNLRKKLRVSVSKFNVSEFGVKNSYKFHGLTIFHSSPYNWTNHQIESDKNANNWKR